MCLVFTFWKINKTAQQFNFVFSLWCLFNFHPKTYSLLKDFGFYFPTFLPSILHNQISFFPSVYYRSYNIRSKSEMLKVKPQCPLATWNPWNESYLLTRNKCPTKLDRLLSNSSSTGRSTHFLEDRQDRIDLFLKRMDCFPTGLQNSSMGLSISRSHTFSIDV